MARQELELGFKILSMAVVIMLLVNSVSSWCLRTIFAGITSIQSVDFSPDGQFIVTGETSGRVLLWKTDTLQILKVYDLGFKLWEAVYNSQGDLIVIGGENDNIHLISASSFSLIKTIATGHGKVHDLDFMGKQLVVTCGNDKKTRVFNTTDKQLYDTVNNHDVAYTCKYGGAEGWVAVGGVNFVQGYDWDGSRDTLLSNYSETTSKSFYGIRVRSGSNYSVAVSSSGHIMQSQLDTSNTQQYITGTTGSLYACAYASDTTYFAVAGGDGRVYMYNATNRANSLESILVANSSSKFKSAQFSDDSNNLIVGNQNGTVYFYYRFCNGCPVGSYPNKTECIKCSQSLVGCSICINSTVCKSCMYGYYMQSGQSACKSCAVIQGCANCNSSTNCTLCTSNYYRTGLTCTRCLTYQYGCVQCDGPLTCLECDKNSYLNAGICIKCTTLTYCIYCNSSSYCLQCIPGYYQNNGVCTQCQSDVNPNCLVCQSSTNCTSCADGYRVNSSRLCQKCSPQCIFCNSTNHCFDCIEQMYVTTSFTCAFCVHPCVTCTSATYCMSCVQSYYISAAGVCSNCPAPCLSCNSSTRCQSCVVGYYFNTGTNKCDKCTIIDPYCRQCTSTVCLACQTQFFLNMGSCQNCTYLINNCQICDSMTVCQQCLAGYYSTGLSGNNSCLICPSDCSNCISSTNCSACVPGYFLLNFGCSSCPSNCLTCKSALATQCSQCVQGFYLSSSTYGSCLNCSAISNCVACHNSSYCVGCHVGYFLASSTTCSACTAACTSCNSSLTDCLTCDLGYYLYTATGGTGACGQCIYGCSECSTSATVCLSCISGYYYDSVGLQCLECRTPLPGCSVCNDSSHCIICEVGYYPVAGVCQPCSTPIPKCLKCNVLGSLCSICDYGFALSATNTSCISCESSLPNCEQCVNSSSCQTCRGGFYENGGSCVSCQTGCITCFNNTFCQVCFDSYILLSSKVCQLCEDAMIGCQFCTSTTVCTNCLLGYFLNGSSCSLCRSSLEGCESCSSGSHCDYCSIYYQMQTNNTCTACSTVYSFCQTCGNSSVGCLDCEMGYFLASTGVCSSCNPGSSQGCLKCTSNVTCLQCMSGYFLNTTSNACQKCDGTFSSCIYCTSTVCSQCESGFYLLAGSCSPCTSQGCQVCLPSSPSLCLTCNQRYYKSGTQCLICSVSMPQCLSCISSSICVECSSGFYLNSINKCSLCSSINPGCSLCSPSSCIECQANFFLNTTDMQCHNCTDHIPGCAFCVSQTICLSCQNGYYNINQTCQYCAIIPGCLYCFNQTLCTQCQQSFFLSLNDSSCYSCGVFIPNCYACTDSLTCISCLGQYELISGQCSLIRGEVLKHTTKIDFKSFYVNDSCLKHILYARDFKFYQVQQNWNNQVELSLTDKHYTKIILVILKVEWGEKSDQIIFYTDNPIADQLAQSMKSMPFLKNTRLLAQASLDLRFNLKLYMSQKAAQQIMPDMQQIGDLYMDFPYFDSSFYQSYVRNKEYFYFLFGYIVTAILFIGFIVKACCIVPSSHDRGGIVPHILAIKCGALALYPTYMEYVSYCAGFMLADLPWLNRTFANALSNPSDTVPQPYKMYYVNLSIGSTYFLAALIIVVIWISLSIIKSLTKTPSNAQKIQIMKMLLYNYFVLGATIAGSLSLQGIILNSVYGLNANTVLYIVGVVMYIGIFGEIWYSWFMSRKYVTQMLGIQVSNRIGTQEHIRKLRIFVKSTLLSVMHIAPLYILPIVMITQTTFIIINYCLTASGPCPKLEAASHFISNLNLLSLILIGDALVGLLICSIGVVIVILCEIARVYYEYRYQAEQIQLQVANQHESNQIKEKYSHPRISESSSHHNDSINNLKVVESDIAIVPLVKTRTKKKKDKNEQLFFSIEQINQ